MLAGFKNSQAANCTIYQDYRRLLDTEKLDAVIIATPDHHHVQAAMLALQAGLDVYLLWVKDDFKVGDLLWRGWDLFREYFGHLMTNWGAHNIDMVQYALGMDESGPVRIMPLDEATAGDRKVDIGESALRRDFETKWSKKTPRPEGTFTGEARFRPVSMEYADGTVLNFVPDITTATFYGERGTMAISRNKFVADPVDLVTDTPDMSDAERWEGGGHVARPCHYPHFPLEERFQDGVYREAVAR